MTARIHADYVANMKTITLLLTGAVHNCRVVMTARIHADYVANIKTISLLLTGGGWGLKSLSMIYDQRNPFSGI